MERISKLRATIFLLVFAVIIGFFALKLYDLQIIETGGKTDNQSTFTTLTRVKAARGDILDKNGNLLVSNRASYDLTLNHFVLLSANGTNENLLRLVKRCEEAGIEYKEHFPISQERPFTYTLDQQSPIWQGYFQTFLNFMGGLDSDITAPYLVNKLRDRYKIPAEWTDDEARKVIGLRYEMSLRQCVNSLSTYVFITDANDEELSTVVELNIPGMKVEASTVREYNTMYAAHILGYVGAMDAEQWEYYQTLSGYDMDAEVGQDGLEAAYEEYLHGVDGWREDTVTADGTLVSSRYWSEPKAGSNVEVSIDLGIQMAAEDTMAQVIENLKKPSEDGKKKYGYDVEGGAFVAMDVKTGQLLACGSYPTYDLSTFFENYEELNKDPLKPLYNRAFQAAYPPGSTYKMTMVVAATQASVINMETEIEDLGIFLKYIDQGFDATCLSYSSAGVTHGHINAREALCVSCNYFFYELADMQGFTWEHMDNAAKGLGLGEHTGIEMPEKLGQRANPETKKKLYDEDHRAWTAADQITAAIGQSDNRFTPLQLCVYASTLANRGTRYSATFLNRVVSTDYRSLILNNEKEIASVMDIPQDAYLSYMEGMQMVAHNRDPALRGTGFTVFGDTYPIRVCAKTGTAQTGINNQDDNGAFLCFAPAEDPQIAVAVYGEKAGSGSAMGIVARRILDSYFDVGEAEEIETYENTMS